jgi:RNA polymerase sigma factor (TIGR02999 family)
MEAVADITRLLQQADASESGAMDELMRVVYAELERMADAHLRRHFGANARAITLEPAALVNETFMRLIKQRSTYDNRGQFFAIATTLMMRVLIDYRRKRLAAKRGSGTPSITIQFGDRAKAEHDSPALETVEVEALEGALSALESLDSRKADVVRMHIVWGMNNTEIAQALDVSIPTVERDWRFAKAWLAEQIENPEHSVADR